MLYDKRWEKPEVKADPFSLESLIAWLEKQPADKPYDYIDSTNCLLCQYFRSVGFNVYTLSGNDFDIRGRLGFIEFPVILQNVSQGDYETERRRAWTYGAALARARAYVACPQETTHE